MKRFLIALNIVVWSIVAVEARAEVQVPNNGGHGTKMYLVDKERDVSGSMLGIFRVTGWKSGVDTYTVVEARCGTNTIQDLAYGEGSIANIKKYPEHLRKFVDIVGYSRGAYYEGSFTYNRYRALCG